MKTEVVPANGTSATPVDRWISVLVGVCFVVAGIVFLVTLPQRSSSHVALEGNGAVVTADRYGDTYIEGVENLEEVSVTVSGDLPPSYAPPTNLVLPVKDQGECNSCWAFALCAALEDATSIRTGGKYRISLSPQYLMSCSGAGLSCATGGYILNAIQFAGSAGVIPEYLYEIANTKATDNFDACTLTASNYRVYVNKSTVARITDADTMKQSIRTNGPLLATIRLYGNELARLPAGQVYRVSDANQSFTRHAVTIVGWDESGFLCKNSWSAGWGVDGYFRVAYGEAGIQEAVIRVEPVVALQDANVQLSNTPAYLVESAYNGNIDDARLAQIIGGSLCLVLGIVFVAIAKLSTPWLGALGIVLLAVSVNTTWSASKTLQDTADNIRLQGNVSDTVVSVGDPEAALKGTTTGRTTAALSYFQPDSAVSVSFEDEWNTIAPPTSVTQVVTVNGASVSSTVQSVGKTGYEFTASGAVSSFSNSMGIEVASEYENYLCMTLRGEYASVTGMYAGAWATTDYTDFDEVTGVPIDNDNTNPLCSSMEYVNGVLLMTMTSVSDQVVVSSLDLTTKTPIGTESTIYKTDMIKLTSSGNDVPYIFTAAATYIAINRWTGTGFSSRETLFTIKSVGYYNAYDVQVYDGTTVYVVYGDGTNLKLSWSTDTASWTTVNIVALATSPVPSVAFTQGHVWVYNGGTVYKTTHQPTSSSWTTTDVSALGTPDVDGQSGRYVYAGLVSGSQVSYAWVESGTLYVSAYPFNSVQTVYASREIQLAAWPTGYITVDYLVTAMRIKGSTLGFVTSNRNQIKNGAYDDRQNSAVHLVRDQNADISYTVY